MRCIAISKRILAACAALVLLSATAKLARAGGVGADTIGLFPKEVAEFAYADLKKARTMKWYPALQEQMLPDRFRQFEKFLASAGVDPNSQVDELVWGLVPESMAKQEKGGATDIPSSEMIVGVAMGSFNPESTEAYFKQQKLAVTDVHGFKMYAFGSGSGASDLFFFFIDSSKAAFGHRQLLEKMIEIRSGGQEGLLRNDKMFNLINEANGSGMVWAVLGPGYTRLALGQLAPEVQQFPEAAKLIQNMQSMIITANAGSGIDGKFQAVCGSSGDANTLSQLMQAGLLYKKYQANKDNPELGQLLDQASVTPSGDRVVINMTLSDDQMSALIKKNTFAFKL
jgi:hypothetical protein